MSYKRKYRKQFIIGNMELFAFHIKKSEYFYLRDRIIHHSWLRNMSFLVLDGFCSRGLIYTAVKNEENK